MTMATVTIPLKEIEELKEKIKQQAVEITNWKSKTDYTITIQVDIDNWLEYPHNTGYAYRCLTYGNFNALKEATTHREMQGVMQEAFDNMIKESIFMRFYTKFPKWVHKLLKCELSK